MHEHHRGGISDAEFEGYMHVWVTSAPRFSDFAEAWRETPTAPDVIHVADAMRAALGPAQMAP